VLGLLSAGRSLIGALLGSAKFIARFRLRRRHAQILGEGLNYSEIEVGRGCGSWARRAIAFWAIGGQSMARSYDELSITAARFGFRLAKARRGSQHLGTPVDDIRTQKCRCADYVVFEFMRTTNQALSHTSSA
jgi:hypothetical protein